MTTRKDISRMADRLEKANPVTEVCARCSGIGFVTWDAGLLGYMRVECTKCGGYGEVPAPTAM